MDHEAELTKALSYVEGMRDRLVAWRRDLHMHPELSGEEERTAALVADHLRRLGLETTTHVGGHGVVGVLGDAQSGETIAYRADMDALPIQDELDKPYRALPLGTKHACGHDAHMAIAMGIAEALLKSGVRLPGAIKFIFQPAEESLDGARAMIEDGVLAAPRPRALLAIHAFPLPAGTLGIRSGLCLAGMDEFKVRFYAPAGNLSALIRRAKCVLEAMSTAKAPTTTTEFDEVLDRMFLDSDLRQAVFVSCWPLDEGQPQKAHLLGLVSIADFDRRPHVHAQIRERLDAVVSEMGASYDLNHTFSNPPLHNDSQLVEAILPQLKEVLGEDRVLEFKAPYPFAHEDLALYTARIPGALIWLGTANRARGIPSLLHTPDYDIDEDALVIGAKAALAAIWSLLANTPMDVNEIPDDQPAG
ncbi:MAG: M20 metallopeptidase family protein [Anaerolineae bacterium]